MALDKFFNTDDTTKKKKVPKKKTTPPPTQEVDIELEQPTEVVEQGLRDIMDRNKLFTMIYSGVENKDYFDILYDLGIRNFLMSYHYIKEKRIDLNQYEGLGVKFFIDSGAHTYQNDPKYQEYTVDYWENHLKGYLKWAEENKEYIFAMASFDYENLVTPATVKEWNMKYFEPFMIRTKIPICFVWHQNSVSTWEQYCERYPYIGFSSVNTEGVSIELKEYMNRLQVAQKHNSLVHGFGMTRTSMLPKLPFYTSDSTTWLVGLQYGEMNFWNGKKMSRLKKDKWQGEDLAKIVALGLDREKLLAEDTTEVIKANVLAFIQAEEYIQTRLKQRMYWLVPIAVKNDINDEGIFDIFPSVDWCDNEDGYSNLTDYAKALNINSTIDADEITGMVIDCTCFCCWDREEYQEFIERAYLGKEGIIQSLHELYLNQLCSTDEERIEQLKKFFWEVVEGKNDKLLAWGIKANIKERDNYIEEEEYELRDVTEKELVNSLQGLLPAPKEGQSAPEIEDLDDEIFSNVGIVAVRDERGKFLKGQKKVKKPKNIYSDKYPKLICDTCYASQGCPEFKEGFVCAYNKMFKRFDCRDAGDIVEAMQGMVNLNMQRLQRVAIFEMIDGGMPDGNLTGMIDQNMRLLMNMKAMYEHGGEVLRHTKTVNADGSMQETTTVKQSAGILEKLFMSNAGNKSEKEIDIDNIIEVEEVKTE